MDETQSRTYVKSTAELLGLRLDEAQESAVAAVMVRLVAMAAHVLAFPLGAHQDSTAERPE